MTQVTLKSHAAVLSSQPGLPKVILFTEKAATAPLFKALALEFRGRALLGEARVKAAAGLPQRYEVETFPKIVLVPAASAAAAGSEGPIEDVVAYDGPIKADKLADFISAHVAPKPGAAAVDKEAPPKKAGGKPKAGAKAAAPEGGDAGGDAASTPPPTAPPPRKAVPPKRWPQVAEADALSSGCFAGPGFCVVALLPGPPDEAGAAALDAEAQRFAADPVRFVWVDATAQAEFATALGVVDAGKATLVAINPKRKKAAVAACGGAGAAACAENASSLVDRLLGGVLHLTPLPDLPVLA